MSKYNISKWYTISEWVEIIYSELRVKIFKYNTVSTIEECKNYLNERLFFYYKSSGMKIDEILPLFKEACSYFSEEDFISYVQTHSSDADSIFGEKGNYENEFEEKFPYRLKCRGSERERSYS